MNEFDVTYGAIFDHLLCGDVPVQECPRAAEHRAEGERHAGLITRARRAPVPS